MAVPRDAGWVAPPDWAPAARFWLAWPQAGDQWSDNVEAARESCAELARSLCHLAAVTVLANPDQVADVSLACGPGIATMALPHSTSCMRVVGPSFLLNEQGQAAGIHWRERGAAGDREVARAVLDHLRLPAFAGPLPAPGGMIDIDGEGTALASQALIRHSGGTAAEIEALLAEWLGVGKVIWLKAEVTGDRTGGHLFNVARFLRPGLLHVVIGGDPADDDHEPLAENLRRLKGARDARGRTFQIVEAPRPRRRLRADGSRMAMSYTDCFVSESLVVLPAFEDGRDDIAYDAVVSALLDTNVVTLSAVELAEGGIGLGSMILPQPKAQAESRQS